MEIFLFRMKNDGRHYNTLRHYIQGFSYYFCVEGLDVVTQDMSFTVFKSGLRTGMTVGGSCLRAKAPFLIDFSGGKGFGDTFYNDPTFSETLAVTREKVHL